MYFGCLLDDYYCSNCDTLENGRIRAVAYTLLGAPLANPSSESDWADLVCNKFAVVIHDVRGTYDGGAEVETAGYGSSSTQLSGINHSATYMHTWDCANKPFYDSLRYSRQYKFWFATENFIHFSEQVVTASAKMPITEDVNSRVEFSVTVKWGYKFLPSCYAMPTKIFTSCEALAAAVACNAPCPVLSVNPC